MTSNAFSKLYPTPHGRSFYDSLRRREGDPEDRAGLLDEENLQHDFHDEDLEHAEGLGVNDSRATISGVTSPASRGRGRPQRGHHRNGRPGWAPPEDDGDNDVPASLLVERHEPNVAGRSHWGTAQPRQRSHGGAGDAFGPSRRGTALPSSLFTGLVSGSAKKKAEWRWANASNLDSFMKSVYHYYLGHGIWCILLDRALQLVNLAFLAFLLTFLTQCVDYGKLRGSQKLPQILVPQCTRNMSGWWNVALWMFAFYFVWKTIQYLLDVRRLIHTRDFYLYLLDIPDYDMQTITWQEIVARIMALRDQNPKTATDLTPEQRRWIGSQSKERLDASDIANRLMRRENYLIAMFNKDILNLSIPLPFLRNRQLFTRTMEWILKFTILDFVFDEAGQVSPAFIRSERRSELSAKLRGRFFFAGIMLLVLSPIVAAYLVIVYFLTYYHEIQKNPSVLSSRTYTPLAEWKFREFNELPHLFEKRLDMSRPFANHYIDQFPKAKTEMVAQTVAFISGALATVLAVASLVDSDLFLGFEITPDRTVLFYTAIFGSIWAFARGSINEENSVFDPEYAMRNVIEYTHYEPDHWKDRLHSYDIKVEFSELYKIKVVIFIEEVLSILIAPFVLFSSLPKCSDQIIDFFREFTIHVDGLGYVCSFAEFDFKKGLAGRGKSGSGKTAGGGDVRDDYYATKHGKMEASYYGFMGHYGNFSINPRTGAASYLPPGVTARNQFHPPPAWPSIHGISSPPLPQGADLQASRMGGYDRGGAGVRSSRHGHGPVAMPQPSPMASILLDPHHQPPASALTPSSRQAQAHPARHGRGTQQHQAAIQESLESDIEESDAGNAGRRADDEEETGCGLDESTWQTSPARTLSRENSEADDGRGGPADAGVVRMIYQFNQQLNRAPGGLR
ncbi:hypothetical protein VTJ49DRAFT_4978 [Mycothermus thermophilus]|uniref:Autophagy-related protein 9 n=1 Tax=Humicola insolens TaxID=85995 RepID=A0ABR3VRN0_HUMIN